MMLKALSINNNFLISVYNRFKFMNTKKMHYVFLELFIFK